MYAHVYVLEATYQTWKKVTDHHNHEGEKIAILREE